MLEAEGILVTRERHGRHVGTVPPPPPSPPPGAERQRRLTEAARAYAGTVRELDVDVRNALEKVNEALAT